MDGERRAYERECAHAGQTIWPPDDVLGISHPGPHTPEPEATAAFLARLARYPLPWYRRAWRRLRARMRG